VFIIAMFELRKFLFNTRGIIALVAFGLVWGVLLLYPIQSASAMLLQPNVKDIIDSLFGANTLNVLFEWPVAEMAVFWCFALYLFPLFSILIAADQFSSDKTRGTLRFLTIRTSRDSLLFGRFLGQILIQGLLILLTIIATVALALSRDSQLFLSALTSGALVGLNLIIVILPYTAVMTLLSLYARTARQAMVFATILWTVISITIVVLANQSSLLAQLQWVLPGAQLSDMLNTNGLNSLVYAPIPLLQTAVALLLGRIYMQRSSL
jgi:ABC-type transport system involved in multi-copper enzyme maturation permease subunit